jgi:nucleoside-diphosphate-sugar epimerase
VELPGELARWAARTPTAAARALPSWRSPPTGTRSSTARANRPCGGGQRPCRQRDRWRRLGARPPGAGHHALAAAASPTLVRNPQATRPWQHVLEPLDGYLMLAERLLSDRHQFASSWNFGPPEHSERSVGWIIERLYRCGRRTVRLAARPEPGPPENTFLKLDASKARAHLGWRCRLDLETTLTWIVDWFTPLSGGRGHACSHAGADRAIHGAGVAALKHVARS